MFAFGVCVGPGRRFRRIARRGLRRTHPDAPVLTRHNQSSIFSAYNSMIDEARTLPGVEGLVLIHDDVELRGDVTAALRECFADPAVGVVGTVGGRDAVFEWWSGERFGCAHDPNGRDDYGGGTHEVDTVDGLLLALSPTALDRLRFDEAHYSGFHGYDADICAEARAAGLRVLVTDLPLFHHAKDFNDINDEKFQAARRAYLAKWTSARG